MPKGTETISYRMPAFALNGRMLIYFAAFKKHIGIYPPVRGDAAILRAVAPYAGEKGNLRFPLDRPIPYPLIARIARSKAKQLAAKSRWPPPAMNPLPFTRILSILSPGEQTHDQIG